MANPEPTAPELVFSFKVFGARIAAAETRDDAGTPVHMRGAPREKPRRSPVRVRLSVDGRMAEREFEAKGISNDGPAIDVWRERLAPGPHEVEIEIVGGARDEPAPRWSGRIEARERRLHVVTYDPAEGFRLE